MTFAPSFAKSSAVALPIPLVEPVMIATLFSNFMAMPPYLLPVSMNAVLSYRAVSRYGARTSASISSHKFSL